MTKTANLTIVRPGYWKHAATGLIVILPGDKKTFEVLNPDDHYALVTPTKFRTLRGAARFLAALEA